MSYLLSISLGPVQGFIAAARKTRDLWFGSYLLGDLSREAATAIQGSGGRLIFPAPQAVAQQQPVANKLLAIVPDPEGASQRARMAAQQRLRAYLDQALDRLQRSGISIADEEKRLARDQAEHFLEFAAAWVPYDEQDAASYPARRAEVERLLAARKQLRDFPPADGREGHYKSSLDPAREALKLGGSPADLRKAGLKQGELLDGVSLIKRLARPLGEAKEETDAAGERFPGTSRIAMDPFIRRLEKQQRDKLAQLRECAEQLNRLDSSLVDRFPVDEKSGLAQFRAFPYNAQLFYDEALDESAPLSDDERNLALAIMKAARELGKREFCGPLSPYFAVLVADGDRMGATLGRLRTPEEHEAFSRTLADFASRTRAIVAEHHGVAIYAGGDDVLAFLPLDTALECADALRRELAALDLPGGARLTLSAGVAIGHFSEHIDRLLEHAREAEKLAKSSGRNSLAVALYTRASGEGVRVAHSWDADPLKNIWAYWQERYRRDELPDRAAYELAALEREYAALTARLQQGLQGFEVALEKEVQQILQRKEAGGERLPRERVEELTERLLNARAREVQALEHAHERLAGAIAEMLIARRIVIETPPEA
jgi:CRISPR-associated protein Cmr2